MRFLLLSIIFCSTIGISYGQAVGEADSVINNLRIGILQSKEVKIFPLRVGPNYLDVNGLLIGHDTLILLAFSRYANFSEARPKSANEHLQKGDNRDFNTNEAYRKYIMGKTNTDLSFFYKNQFRLISYAKYIGDTISNEAMRFVFPGEAILAVDNHYKYIVVNWWQYEIDETEGYTLTTVFAFDKNNKLQDYISYYSNLPYDDLLGHFKNRRRLEIIYPMETDSAFILAYMNMQGKFVKEKFNKIRRL